MNRLRLVLVPVALLVSAIGLVPLFAPGPSAVADKSDREIPLGIFAVVCDYTQHSLRDDPVIYPGQPGKSHLHDFFGSKTVNAGSTGHSLLGSETTCTRPKDSAGYWSPALYAGNTVVRPKHMKIYYQSYRATAGAITAPPTDFSMIAGDRKGTQPKPDKRQVWYSCAKGDTSTSPPATTPPSSCPAGSDFQISLRFPSCWDGKTLNGADQTNVKYDDPATHACPSGYPVRIPELKAHIHYPVPADMTDLHLAFTPTMTGSIYSAHTDFLNAWNPDELRRLIDLCLNVTTETRCGAQPGRP